MSKQSYPALQEWYQDTDSGRSFQVVALDMDNDAIDIQYEDGDIAELDVASWWTSGFAPIQPPEDWTAPYDEMEIDDLGYTDTDRHARDQDGLTLEDVLDDENY